MPSFFGIVSLMPRDEEAGLTGVRFFMAWIGLIVASLCVRHHPIGLWIVASAAVMWAAAAIRYLIGRIRQGVSADMFESDMDLVLPAVALVLTGMWAMVAAALALHIAPLRLALIICALSNFAIAARLIHWRRAKQRRRGHEGAAD